MLQRRLVSAGAAVLALVAAGALLLPAPEAPGFASDLGPATRHGPAEAGGDPAAVGPWGVLDVTDIWLEPPESLLATLPTPDQRPLWRFAGADVAALFPLLRGVGLLPREVAGLVTPETCVVDNHGITLLPSSALVLGLPAAVRQKLYEELARHPDNELHQYPLLLPADFERQLASTRLSARQREAVTALQWRQGESRVFSDRALLVQLATTADEIAAAKRIFTRATAVRISVRPGGHLAAADFERYWSAGRRNLEPQSLLRAVAAQAGARTVDAALLLPPLCRERLYTYPGIGDAVGGRFPDCHWSALNFFADTPRPYYLDAQPAFVLLPQDYEPIEAPRELGDLVCFVDARGDFVHSCVYVAGGVVFTKNGSGVTAPWILQRLRETRDIYGARGGVSARYLRLKLRPS